MSFFYRLGLRAISSVVPKSDIEVRDFPVKNEPILGYLPGSQERKELESALNKFGNQTEDCPIVIGGKEYRTDNVQYQVMVGKKMSKLLGDLQEVNYIAADITLKQG